MKNFNRKIKSALVLIVVLLIAFIGFSKAGILFSADGGNVVTVSTLKQTFDSKKYVASVAMLNELPKEETTTKQEETTTITTQEVTTTSITTTTVVTTTVPQTTLPSTSWTGAVLTKSAGVVYGPSGKETYYNLNMSGVVSAMRSLGFSEEEYPYWVREDGVKMLGSYVMVAANYEIRPKGSIIESSVGMAIVCDTGGFASYNPTQLDIATTW